MNQRIKNRAVRSFAWILSGAVCAGSVMPALAASSPDLEKNQSSVSDEKNEAKDTHKEETVYVKLNADGQPKQVIVSDWLKNSSGGGTITDQSDLKDIKNVKGTESFTEDASGEMVWKSGGNDIYYQGTSDKKLPVDVKITYTLDGKEISAGELAGKSGQVTIHYDFTNTTSNIVYINGSKENVVTPFAVVTGLVLPGDRFKNVTVTGGKVISDGSKSVVAAIAFPGLNDSLKLDSLDMTDSIHLPEDIEVTADVTDFSLDMSAMVVTNSIFDELGIDDIDDMDELTDALTELSDASKALLDGCAQLDEGISQLQSSGTPLFEGLDQLKNSTKTLLDGVTELVSGEKQLQSGADALNDGAKSADSGAKTLQDGVEKYTEAVDTLADGVKAYAAGTNTLGSGVSDYMAGAEALCGGIDLLAQQTEALPEGSKALSEGSAAIKAGSDQLVAPETVAALQNGCQSVQDNVAALHDNIVALEEAVKNTNTPENLPTMMTLMKSNFSLLVQNDQQVLNILNNVSGDLDIVDRAKAVAPENIQAKVNGYEQDLQTAITLLDHNIAVENQLIAMINSYTEGGSAGTQKGAADLLEALDGLAKATDPENKESLYAGAALVNAGVHQMIDGNQKLNMYIGQMDESIGTFKDSSQKLYSGIQTLNEGAQKLTESSTKLPEGIQLLNASSNQLLDGVDELLKFNDPLKKGSSDLSFGLDSLYLGTVSLCEGLDAFDAGMSDLNAGGILLADGVDQLSTGGRQMSDGINALAEGSHQLYDGMQTFDSDGIQKLTELMGDEAQTLIERFDAVLQAGRDYETFTGLSENASGSVKFIIETEPVEKE